MSLILLFVFIFMIWVTSGSPCGLWVHFGIVWGSPSAHDIGFKLWCHFGITSKTLWGHFEVSFPCDTDDTYSCLSVPHPGEEEDNMYNKKTTGRQNRTRTQSAGSYPSTTLWDHFWLMGVTLVHFGIRTVPNVANLQIHLITSSWLSESRPNHPKHNGIIYKLKAGWHM